MMPDDLAPLFFEDQEALERWLAQNHAASDGIWIRFAKVKSGIRSVSYAEAVESALSFGWIDGQRRSLDGDFWMQRYTPRRRRSIWSKINRDNAERLIAEGRMRPAGLAEVERAKGDGRWDAAYDPSSRLTIPDELQAALDGAPDAAARFAALKSAERYAIVFRIQNAKRPETRARRAAEAIAALRDARPDSAT